jgi:hypothetical protein
MHVPIRLGDRSSAVKHLDSGENRDAERLLSDVSNIGAVAIVIAGFEVDDERLYEEQIDDLFEAYWAVIAGSLGALIGSLSALGVTIAVLLGASGGWASAIATAITITITLVYA